MRSTFEIDQQSNSGREVSAAAATATNAVVGGWSPNLETSRGSAKGHPVSRSVWTNRADGYFSSSSPMITTPVAGDEPALRRSTGPAAARKYVYRFFLSGENPISSIVVPNRLFCWYVAACAA